MDPHSPIFDLAATMALDKVAEYDRRSRDHLQDFHMEARDEAESLRTALRTILAARDLSPDEPIPTALEAAIFAARKVVA